MRGLVVVTQRPRGATGLKYSSQASSAAATKRCTPADRQGETSSMLNHGETSPLHCVGSWYSHIMYGSGRS